MSQVAFVVDIGSYSLADLPSFAQQAEEVAQIVKKQLPVTTGISVNRVVTAAKDIVNTESMMAFVAGAVAGNHTVTGIKTSDRIISVGHVANDPTTQSITIAGAAAGSHSGVTGIVATSIIKSVISVDDTTHAGTDLTSEYLVAGHGPGTGTVDNTGGTSSVGAHLVIVWHAAPVLTITDKTSEYVISAADTINNGAGTTSAGLAILVMFERN